MRRAGNRAFFSAGETSSAVSPSRPAAASDRYRRNPSRSRLRVQAPKLGEPLELWTLDTKFKLDVSLQVASSLPTVLDESVSANDEILVRRYCMPTRQHT
jgi:hypothetical protein